MAKKKDIKPETVLGDMTKTEINEAIDTIEAFINGKYKSMYLHDYWLRLRDALEKL